MLFLSLLLACTPSEPPEQLEITVAASLWLGEGGHIRACDPYSRICDVTTLQGAEVRLKCRVKPRDECLKVSP